MLDNVCTVTEVLNGSVKYSGKKVAIIGSGMTGMETAELLTEQGNELIIIEMADKVAPGAWMQHKDDIMPKLAAHNVGIYTGEKLLKIEADGITTENVKTKKQTKFEVENVVLSLGVRPVNGLAEELKPVCEKVYVVGDASKVGRIHDATTAAFNLAAELN